MLDDRAPQESDDPLLDAIQACERLRAVRDREESFILRRLAAAIVERRQKEREAWTQTSGLPCPAFDFQLEAAPDIAHEVPVGFVEPVDSSQMIPPEQMERSARGGE